LFVVAVIIKLELELVAVVIIDPHSIIGTVDLIVVIVQQSD